MQTVGYCPFCGQGVQIDAPDNATKEEREQIAALNCGCDGAKEKRAALELARKVRRNIRELFGKGTKEDEERNAEIVSYLLKGGQMVCDSDFEKITISLWGASRPPFPKRPKAGLRWSGKTHRPGNLLNDGGKKQMATGWSVLDALNRESRAEVEERPKARFRTKDISIKRIYANEKNFYSMTGIEALAGEILAAGLIENLTVTYAPCDKGEYRLIAGERRYRALKLLVDQGYTEFETATCQIKAPAEEHEETVQLILANGYREKTVADVLEEEKRLKEALQYMRDNGLKLAGYELDSGRLRDVIAGMMNTSPTRIAQIESINKNLLPEMRRAVDEGRLTFSAAYEVSGMDETGQRQMLEKFRDQGALSIADVRAAKAAQAAALEAAQAAPDAGDGLEHTPAAQGNTAAQDGPERAAQDAGEDYIDPAPERVLSICYKCARYTLCNEKRSDVRACNAYLDKAERDKTPEQRYAEEQAAIDRETARAMKERAREDRLDKALNQKPEKTVIVGVTELNEIMRGEKLFLLLKNDGYAKGQEITLTGYDHGKPANTGLKVRVMYLLEDYKGLEDGYCILQISVTGITAAQDAPDAGDGPEYAAAVQAAQEAQAEAQAAQDAITDALDDMDALERAGHE